MDYLKKVNEENVKNMRDLFLSDDQNKIAFRSEVESYIQLIQQDFI